MSKRNSFSQSVGKFLGFFAASYSSSDLINEEKRDSISNKDNSNNNNNKYCNMAHPGLPNKNNDVFDTKNFDKIDYIVQIPLIDNPNCRQTRFLLAMNYTLPPRDGLGIMDTALEHIVHYYDMNKVELIFCEMWQSVCLFIEFHDTTSCTNAYNQLFQFFKTIFYVENLSELEELWICAHCKHYNQFDEYLRGLNSINDKRKNAKGDEYIYWCNRCKNVNHPSFKKIKYSYQKTTKINKKSNRDQIGSISKPKPEWNVNAKSQPIASTSAIYAQISSNHNYYKPTPRGPVEEDNDDDIKKCNDNRDDDKLRTPAGTDILMGHAQGPLKFNLPNNNNNNNNKRSLNVLIPSKSMDCLQHHKLNNNHQNVHYRHDHHGSHGSGGGISSSPELVSPASSTSIAIGHTPPKDIPFGLNVHGKKYSVDSQISVTSTTSTVSSIDNNLDLCCTILETIDQETSNLNILNRNNQLIYDENVTHQNLQQLEQQKKDVINKIAKLTNMLRKIENTFTSAIDNHKYLMSQHINIENTEMKQDNDHQNDPIQQHHNNNGNVYKALNHKPTRGGPQNNNPLTSQNLYQFQQNQLLSDPDNNYTHSAPHYDDDDDDVTSHSDGDDEDDINDNDLRTPAGTDILMGAAHGPISFNLPNSHNQ